MLASNHASRKNLAGRLRGGNNDGQRSRAKRHSQKVVVHAANTLAGMETVQPRSIEHNVPLADGEEVVTHARTRTLVASIGAPWVPVVIQLAEGVLQKIAVYSVRMTKPKIAKENAGIDVIHHSHAYHHLVWAGVYR